MSLHLLEQLAMGIDLVSVGIMCIGFILAVARFLPTLLKQSRDAIDDILMIRCSLGTYLVFALELMIVSDLIHSIVSRTLEDLYYLAAIVLLRTLIAFFLNREIQELQGSETHHRTIGNVTS